MTSDQIKALETFPGCGVVRDASLKSLTTFRVGGKADILICPETTDAFAALLTYLFRESIPYVLMGRGSNMLFADEGCRVPVISTVPGLTGIALLDDNRLQVQAGAALRAAAAFALDKGLTGLEFAHGIPGTLGGGIYMNAGAYGGQMADVTESVCLFEEGREITVSGAEMAFGYRESRARRGGIVLSAILKLDQGEPAAIGGRMKELAEKRRASQPLEFPSAGSFFKRPDGYYAAALIDKAGLKGCSVGGAMVSPKHAGFVINTGNATCGDILALKEHVQRTVFERFGVRLEPEVALIDDKGHER